MSVEEVNVLELLEKLSCKMSHCAGNKHYFDEKEEFPVCRECGVDLIDWEQVRKRDFKDVEKTFNYLRHECVRHVYWCRDFDQRAINYALRRGKIELLKRAEHRIRVYMSKPAHLYGKLGTSWEKNPIHYAQHATATCCRECIEKWHGVPSGDTLNEEQIIYFTKLVIRYLEERFPNLPDVGQKVPPIRGEKNAKKYKRRNDH
jgi:ribosomal protein L34E